MRLAQLKINRKKKKKQSLQSKKNKELSFLRLMMKSLHITVMILMSLSAIIMTQPELTLMKTISFSYLSIICYNLIAFLLI
jgi:hypothetical protein